ncbi:rhodanese-like domain-containing protein [Bacteroidota bacterium]
MKELEKTKRIRISSVLFLLVIVVGVLTFKKPQHVFDKNSASTLEKVVQQDYILSKSDLKKLSPSEYQLIDLRSTYEYEKSHLNGAVNIPTHNVIDNESIEFFNKMNESNRMILLYSDHPNNADSVWMFLYQMGYENAKILSIETLFVNNQFQTKNIQIEKPLVNYAEVLKSSKSQTSIRKTSKKIITVRKKKKSAPEGGC